MTKSQLDRLCSRNKLHVPPRTLNNSISSSASFLFQTQDAEFSQEKKKKPVRKYSGQCALTKRNFTCTTHRANLILSLWKNWELLRPQLGKSWIEEWSKHRRRTAQTGIIFLSNADRFVCTRHPNTVCQSTLKAPLHSLSVLWLQISSSIVHNPNYLGAL